MFLITFKLLLGMFTICRYLIRSNSLESNDLDSTLLQIQITADISKSSEVNQTISKQIQTEYIQLLSDISQGTEDIPPADAILQSETLKKLVSLGTTGDTVALDVVTNLIDKVSLEDGEVLDSRISKNILDTVDKIITGTLKK